MSSWHATGPRWIVSLSQNFSATAKRMTTEQHKNQAMPLSAFQEKIRAAVIVEAAKRKACSCQ
jgi:hypothetical protein